MDRRKKRKKPSVDPDLRLPATAVRRMKAAERKAGGEPDALRQRKAMMAAALVLAMALLSWFFSVSGKIRSRERDLSEAGLALSEREEALETRLQAATFEVRYQVPGMDDLTESVLYGDEATLREPVELKGYTFLGWEDREGKLEDRERFPVYRDTLYTARYALAFETEKHIAYLHTDEEGILDTKGPVTNREFVRILYTLLNLDEVGSGRFEDVSRRDPCFKAAATLKDLGVITGSRLHPDEELSLGEMLKTLCRFFPQTKETFDFEGLEPYEEYYPYFCTAAARGWISAEEPIQMSAVSNISRGEFARIMNRVLNRDAERHLTEEDVGTVLDVPPSSEYYDDVAEALIEHDYRMEEGVEVWTESEAMPLHEPGFFFVSGRLHYVAEDGTPAAGCWFMGLHFNQNGEVTCGNEDLDEALGEIVRTETDPEHMTQEEMLKAVYDYVVKNFNYRYGRVYDRGARGWAIKEAKRMLENRAGNCYGFAALFYELARFVGYNAKIYSGIVYGEQYEYNTEAGALVIAPQGYTPHGWVEIEFDGESYIFDTEYEYRSGGMLDMFKAGMATRGQFGYLE